MKEIAIGIDIGGTNTAFGLVERNGNCIAEGSVPTSKHSDINKYIEELFLNISKATEPLKANIKIAGIGIGAPNGNYNKGTIEHAPNLLWKGIIPFTELFAKYFDIPLIKLTNDANAAAIGEMIYGGAKGMKDFIVITLGTGLGSGIVSGGKLVYGHDGFAGELGHINVKPGGRVCGCGRKGCLEAYVSATGIKRTVYKLLADSMQESELRDVSFNRLTAKMISEAADRGDQIAISAFEYTGRILGLKLADAVAHTSPEAIFLFGGLAAAGDYIFEPTRRYFEENLFGIYKGKTQILPSQISGNVAILGASALVWSETENH